jgi:peptidyl-prolyl cis-trans isomerase SurA
MQEFGVGQYDPLFENIVFNNLKNGEISKPFLTSYGYHIVKRIAKVPVVSNKADAKAREALRSKVEADDRINTTKETLAKKVMNSINFKQQPFNTNELWAFSDSVLDYKTKGTPLSINNNTPLFKMGNETTTAANWVVYAQTFRYKSDGSGIKPYPQLWDEFVKATALEYYRAHLEDFNDAFKRQLAEFNEGNLFFEIMQRKVWTPAQTDSVALQAYYNNHRSKYMWGKSADAILFYASDANAAKDLYNKLKTNPAAWKNMVAATEDKVAADSGRFEVAQIPNGAKVTLAKGVVTAPVVNPGDQTTSFAYVLNLHNNTAPRSFAEAKSLVVNDYQTDLDKEWIAQLKKKYPVVVNEKAVAGLMKSK